MLDIQIFKDEKIVPVIRENSFKDGHKNSELSIEAGLNTVEVTFTTPNAHKIVEDLVQKYPNKTIGVGTIITVEQAELAIKSGAEFIVSPAFSKKVSQICKKANVLYVPGAITPTEVITIAEEGWKLVKIFPGSLVGTSYVKAIKSVQPQLDFMVTGGVSPENLNEWLATPVSACGLGSALFKGTETEIKNRIKDLKRKVNA